MALHTARALDPNRVWDDMNEQVETISADHVPHSGLDEFFVQEGAVEAYRCFKVLSSILLSPLYHITPGHTRSADETLFGRQYVTPLLIDPGFITEELSYEVIVWNADLQNITTLSSITVQDQEGTTISYPTLPKDIPRGYDEILTITILTDGPPTQDTTYTITVGSFSYEVDVQGLRAIGLPVDPDWKEGMSVTYSWMTAFGNNLKYFREQRKPLTLLPWRNIKFTAAISELQMMAIVNTLRYGHDKVFVIPIYAEQIICNTISTGTNTITPSVAYDQFYNLQNNCTHLLFYDSEDNEIEIKEVDTVGASDITFTANISGTFNANSTAIYPVVFSTLAGINSKGESQDLEVIQLRFEEFKKSG